MNKNMAIYKPDWQEAKQRMADWWDGKKTDRAIIQARARLQNPAIKTQEYISSSPDIYINPEAVLNNVGHNLERGFFGGESFPCHLVYFGPMFNVAYFGCEPNFLPETVWYKPIFNDIRELLDKISVDPNNRWWQLTKEITRRSLERANGSYVVSMMMSNSFIDMLAELVDKESLLASMADEPELIKQARDRLAAWSAPLYAEICKIVNAECDGSLDWMNVWGPGKVATAQCDYSVMISPEMFEEFVVPDLEATYSISDNCIYHLDGEEEIRHLDLLLAIRKLKLIQWIPSTKMAMPDYNNPMNWLPLFKRIQAAGKSVLIYCQPGQVTELLSKLDPRLVVLNTWCNSEEEAKQAIKAAERIGC